ncbi:MAG: GPP34 family phosphoprotein [Mycolicibacterium hassiacum]|jgi:hypothetical protein|nr:MAG: GPP34 family phosphoprotein [Mycolicibacterium hassiacum]
MAQIAEDLLLLLLDNASAQPALDSARRRQVLAAAVLADLAYACRIRPAVPGEPVEPGRLIALLTPAGPDPVVEPAYQLLRRRPLTPAAAVKRLARHTEDQLLTHLEQIGLVRRVRLAGKRFNHDYAWPMNNRERVERARAALLSTLFDRTAPGPSTAATVTLLHAVDGLGALLSLNDRGWRWVHARAGEIAGGGWVDESPASLPEMNLAITMSALRPALN